MGGREIIVEPVVQFRSKSVLLYNQYHRVGSHYKQTKLFTENVEKLKETKKYTGQMTAGSRKRLAKAVSLLVQSSTNSWVYNPVIRQNQYHRLSFITLTLPSTELSKDAAFTHKHLLQPFLRIMRNKYDMNTYVWKAELQENESIHYHITSHSFIIYTAIRAHWNALLRKHGMLDSFKQKYGHDDPNSTDVHSVNKVGDLEAYLIKYVSKESQNGISLAGKVWDCSKNLKQASYFTTTETAPVTEILKRDVATGQCSVIEMDHCTILKYSSDGYFMSFGQNIINDYYSHLNTIREWHHSELLKSTMSTTTSAKSSNDTKMKKTPSASRTKKKQRCSSSSQLSAFQTMPSGYTLPATTPEPSGGFHSTPITREHLNTHSYQNNKE